MGMGAGGSFSKGGGSFEASAAVDIVGAETWARGWRTVGGYDGGLNNPFVFFSFGAEGVGIVGVAIGNVGVMTAVPFSDATILAIVSDAAAAAALRDVGAVAAWANARTAGSTSGKPMAGVRRVLMGSRSGSAIPRLPRVFRFFRLFISFSRSFSLRSISLSLR